MEYRIRHAFLYAGAAAASVPSEDFLVAHNTYRAALQMRNLTWSDDLANFAEAWATTVRDEYNCEGVWHSEKEQRLNPQGVDYHYVGENIAWRWAPADAETNAQQVIDSWMAELTHYAYGRFGEACTSTEPGSSSSGPRGGFTQLLWAETTEVGCVDYRCTDNGSNDLHTLLVVCNYGPGGNVQGVLPFSPKTATKLGLQPEPCDGSLSEGEDRFWISADSYFGALYPEDSRAISFSVTSLLAFFAVHFL